MQPSQQPSSATLTPVAVKLDLETRDRIKRLATSKKRTPHWMMKEAIQQYVDREEKREAYRQEGLNAWQEFQTTGSHVTGAEADAWLAKLESGQDVEPPECHA